MDRTKLFRNGNSLAVRLPKKYALPVFAGMLLWTGCRPPPEPTAPSDVTPDRRDRASRSHPVPSADVAAPPDATTYQWQILAGSEGGSGNADGTGHTARFCVPTGIALDQHGNAYVADTNNHTIRKITDAGVVSTFAGVACAPGYTDGVGSAARFRDPTGVAVDSHGNLYIGDSGNVAIRKITPSGKVTTFANRSGKGIPGDGIACHALISNPSSVAVDSQDNVYVIERDRQSICKITPDGVISDVPGRLLDKYGCFWATTIYAGIPAGVAVDPAGNIYMADTLQHMVHKITPEGVVTTHAGNRGQAGNRDGTAAEARFNAPTGVAVDPSGNIYIADNGNRTIRKITPEGLVTTLAGDGSDTTATSADGIGRNARFINPWGLAVDGAGNVWVTDASTWYSNVGHTIRRITPEGSVSTLAGSSSMSGYVNGRGTAARFCRPQGIVVDQHGNLYVADTGNGTIRKITRDGVVSTFAGLAKTSTGANESINNRVDHFTSPTSIAIDHAGNCYVADSGNVCIRKITPRGRVSVLAGKPGPRLTFSDGHATEAGFIEPQGIALAPDGSVYVSDSQTIRKITTAGTTTTFAGLPAANGFKNGDGKWALFHDPVGLAADTQGNLYLADRGNNSIRRITKSGMVSTFNEWGADWGLSCDLGGYKRLRNPTWVAVDVNHNLYVSDFDSRILQIRPGGRTLTLNDPTGKGVRFSNPKGVTVDRNGKVYVLEADHITVGSPVVCPGASTSRATDILATSATLQGTIQASGATTFARFEYGLTEDYDHSIDVIPPPAKRNAVGNVSAVISGLERGKTYHYRLICGNRQGTGVGADASFTTTWGVITFAGSPTRSP